MYLSASRYVGNWDHTKAEEREKAQAVGKILGIDPLPGNSITVSISVAYWRKANAIHQWFVDNCQDGTDDCKEYDTSRDKLRELVSLCKSCLAVPAGAPEHLPTKSGFFFGSTEYNDDYREDLESTIKQIEPLLTDPKWEHFNFEYHSSW